MGLEVVAEGVETLAQLTLLQSLGCSTMQEFYLGRPVASSEFEKLLRNRSSPPCDIGLVHHAD